MGVGEIPLISRLEGALSWTWPLCRMGVWSSAAAPLQSALSHQKESRRASSLRPQPTLEIMLKGFFLPKTGPRLVLLLMTSINLRPYLTCLPDNLSPAVVLLASKPQ